MTCIFFHISKIISGCPSRFGRDEPNSTKLFIFTNSTMTIIMHFTISTLRAKNHTFDLSSPRPVLVSSSSSPCASLPRPCPVIVPKMCNLSRPRPVPRIHINRIHINRYKLKQSQHICRVIILFDTKCVECIYNIENQGIFEVVVICRLSE